MNLYERWILPPILDLIMQQKHLAKYRRAVVAAAHGRVLEIGVGSGLNFPLYGKQVELSTASIHPPDCWPSRSGVPKRRACLYSLCRDPRPRSRLRTTALIPL